MVVNYGGWFKNTACKNDTFSPYTFCKKGPSDDVMHHIQLLTSELMASKSYERLIHFSLGHALIECSMQIVVLAFLVPPASVMAYIVFHSWQRKN